MANTSHKDEYFTRINQSADFALFSGEINALVVSLYHNERPLAGLAGLIDWRTHGLISTQIRKGAIVGTPGECVYIPYAHNQKTYHFIFIGAGNSNATGERGLLPSESWVSLKKNLIGLRFEKIAVSITDLGSDLGFESQQKVESQLQTHLKGIPLWIVQ